MPCDYESTDYLPYVILGFYNRQIVALSRLRNYLQIYFLVMCLKAVLEDLEMMILKALGIQPGIVIATFNLSLTYREMGEEEVEIYTKVFGLPKMNFRDNFAKRKAKYNSDEVLN
ncbi:MAG: hypothetical protein ACE1ZQ_05585 [Ignavibacteriaceae bacterium]